MGEDCEQAALKQERHYPFMHDELRLPVKSLTRSCSWSTASLDLDPPCPGPPSSYSPSPTGSLGHSPPGPAGYSPLGPHPVLGP